MALRFLRKVVSMRASPMSAKREIPDIIKLQPRIRILRGKEIAFGPGKADLLEHIRETGSIAAAAEAMGVSYMRAWSLVKTMNDCFTEPLVISARGGHTKGGARLSSEGEKVLAIYRKMESASEKAIAPPWLELKNLLRK